MWSERRTRQTSLPSWLLLDFTVDNARKYFWSFHNSVTNPLEKLSRKKKKKKTVHKCLLQLSFALRNLSWSTFTLKTVSVYVIQMRVKVFWLALNAFWQNQRNDTTDFHMKYTHNVLMYPSQSFIFKAASWHLPLVYIVGENLSSNILPARTTYIVSFSKKVVGEYIIP